MKALKAERKLAGTCVGHLGHGCGDAGVSCCASSFKGVPISTYFSPFSPSKKMSSAGAVIFFEGEGEKEVVIEELQTGYVMNGQVIRHAMVKVGKK